MAPNRIRTALVLSLVAPLVVAGCGAAAHPTQAGARPAVSRTAQKADLAAAGGPANQTPAAPAGQPQSAPAGQVQTAPAVPPQPATGGQPPASSSPTVTTTGSGSASGTPQIMTLSIGVTTTAAHAGQALSDSSAKASAVQQTLRGAGVAPADIQTSQLSLSPSYDNNTSTPSGYQATNTVTAKLRDLSKAGKVIDDAVTAAGDAGRLEGVSFSIDDSSAFATAARKMAVAQARSRADELAAAAGMKVSGLHSLSEGPDQTPYRSFGGAVPTTAAAAGSAAPAVPIQPGVEQTTVNVTAVWDLTAA